MARSLHSSSAASMSANGPLKPSKLKKKKKKRIEREILSNIVRQDSSQYRITHPFKLSRLNAEWASPEG